MHFLFAGSVATDAEDEMSPKSRRGAVGITRPDACRRVPPISRGHSARVAHQRHVHGDDRHLELLRELSMSYRSFQDSRDCTGNEGRKRLKRMSSVGTDDVVPTTRVNSTDMNLFNHFAESSSDTVGHRHGSVNLARVGDVEAETGIRQFFKDALQFLDRPPYWLAFVHVLDEEERP